MELEKQASNESLSITFPLFRHWQFVSPVHSVAQCHSILCLICSTLCCTELIAVSFSYTSRDIGCTFQSKNWPLVMPHSAKSVGFHLGCGSLLDSKERFLPTVLFSAMLRSQFYYAYSVDMFAIGIFFFCHFWYVYLLLSPTLLSAICHCCCIDVCQCRVKNSLLDRLQTNGLIIMYTICNIFAMLVHSSLTSAVEV